MSTRVKWDGEAFSIADPTMSAHITTAIAKSPVSAFHMTVELEDGTQFVFSDMIKEA